MQTFLPFSSFRRSAEVLDPRRLGKQRVEVLQILRALLFPDYGWQSHPVVCMWRGFDEALVRYGLEVVDVWLALGFSDSVGPLLREFLPRGRTDARSEEELARIGSLPSWLGWEALHRSHRSQLVRKDPAFYRARFPDVPDDLPYAWPPPVPFTMPLSPVSAWVVRARSRQAFTLFRRENVVGLPAMDDAGSKGARQVDAFRNGMRVGDAVLVPERNRLHVATLRGQASVHPRAGLAHRRRVEWHGVLDKRAFALPARFQDPRLVFAVHDEQDPRALVACHSSREEGLGGLSHP